MAQINERNDLDISMIQINLSQICFTNEILSNFLFFVLFDKVTKNENMFRDFLYDVLRLQGKTGKTKMKDNKKTKNYYAIFLFFITFVNKTKNERWDEKLISSRN